MSVYDAHLGPLPSQGFGAGPYGPSGSKPYRFSPAAKKDEPLSGGGWLVLGDMSTSLNPRNDPDPIGGSPDGVIDAGLYAFQDRMGSVVALSEDDSPSIVERFTYSAYGDLAAWWNPAWNGSGYSSGVAMGRSVFGLDFGFTGQRLDYESGLQFFKSRYYECRSGRFLSRDRVGYKDGPNLYTYTHGAVTEATDPLGLAATSEFQNLMDMRDYRSWGRDAITMSGLQRLPTPRYVDPARQGEYLESHAAFSANREYREYREFEANAAARDWAMFNGLGPHGRYAGMDVTIVFGDETGNWEEAVEIAAERATDIVKRAGVDAVVLGNFVGPLPEVGDNEVRFEVIVTDKPPQLQAGREAAGAVEHHPLEEAKGDYKKYHGYAEVYTGTRTINDLTQRHIVPYMILHEWFHQVLPPLADYQTRYGMFYGRIPGHHYEGYPPIPSIMHDSQVIQEWDARGLASWNDPALLTLTPLDFKCLQGMFGVFPYGGGGL